MPDIERFRDFARLSAQTIQPALDYRLQQLRNMPRILGLLGDTDSNSVSSCCLAVNSVDTSLLASFGLFRAAGIVEVRADHVLIQSEPHAYFAHKDDPDVVVDFVVGQFARVKGVKFEHWLRTYQGLFEGRVLVSTKPTIRENLGIFFPPLNLPFEQIYLQS